MFESLDNLGPLQFALIAFFGVLSTVTVLFLLLRQGKLFTASDGKEFTSEKAYVEYEAIYQKVNLLYQESAKDINNSDSFGFKDSFLKLLKEKGFSEVKILMANREEIKRLAALLNPGANKA